MSSETVRVAAVQLNSQDNLEQNLAACRQWVHAAASAGAKLVLLPENFAYFGPEAGRLSVAESLADPGPIQTCLAKLAATCHVALVAGGFPEQGPDERRSYNTCLAYDEQGHRVASYRKIHLFDVDLPDGTRMLESSSTAAGGEAVVVSLAGLRCGLSICYDLRFPELYRRLVDRGAELLVVPAAFTLHTGRDHWHVLLRARAIESQCWLLAAGQWGRHPQGRTTFGHSLVVDPWGAVVSDSSDRVGFVTADVDLGYLKQVRSHLPCLTHRVLG